MSIRRIFHRLNTTIAGGALLIAFFSALSSLLGLLRDRLLAHTFGASGATDVYFASFRIPDFAFNILVLGALTSSFIPVFQKVWARDQREGLRLANAVMNILLIVMLLVCTVLFFLAPLLTQYIVPGFSAAGQEATAALTRIILLGPIFLTLSNVISGILNAWGRFFTFALSPVMYNVGIIVGIVVLYPFMGLSGLAVGVVFGALLHAAVQFIEARRAGWRYEPLIAWSHDIRRVFSLMIPRIIGLAANQINIIVMTTMASVLPVGSLAIFNYANNLQSFPIGIFGISLAVAAFPSFSKFLHENNTGAFKEVFAIQFRRILYFLIPISLLLFVLRYQIVRVILGTGSFGVDSIAVTARTLGFFSLSIVTQGLLPILTRSFYALEDTRTPVIVSIGSIALNIILSLALVPLHGVSGLAFAFSASSVTSMILLFMLLRRRLGSLHDAVLVRTGGLIIAASAASAFVAYGVLGVAARAIDVASPIGALLQGGIAGIAGILVYGALTLLSGLDDARALARTFARLPLIFRNNGNARE